MAEHKVLEELSRKISDILAHSPARDAEKNVRALLQSVFARLDLVTREEFDVQQALLQRTREKLDQLETRLAELEKLRPAEPESEA